MTHPTSSRPRVRPEAQAAWAVFLILAPVYLATMNRTVGFIDRGELAAVAATAGIAHPTGYPTLTLLGFLATRLVPTSPVLVLNALAALLVAAGAAVMTLLFARLLRDGADATPDPRGAGPRAWCAALAALLCAFTETWWQQANGFEAYALHALFLPLVLLLYLRFVARTLAGARDHSGLAFAFVLGLSFTNHLTTILLVPALLAHGFVSLGWRGLARLPRLAPAFALGLVPYLWLPLRAAADPRFSWGDPDSPGRFLAHVSGRQYQGWMLSFGDSAREQLAYFAARLPGEWAWGGLALAAVGGMILARRHRRAGLLAGVLLVTTVVYACGYRIRDIDAYFMTAVVALGIGVAFGLDALFRRARVPVAAAAALALVAASAGIHARPCDESANTLAADLARNQLETLPPRAVLFTSQWDYGLSASLYLQEVEGLRPDVLVVNLGHAHLPWYQDELARRDPEAGLAMRPAFERHRQETEAASECPSCEPALRRASDQRLLEGIADPRRLGRPSFVTLEVEWPGGSDLARAPVGLAWRVVTDTGYVAQPVPSYRWRAWPNRADHYVATTSWIYGYGLAARMEYEAAHGRPERAREWGRAALAFDPGFGREDLGPLPWEGRALAEQSLALFDALRGRDLAERSAAR